MLQLLCKVTELEIPLTWLRGQVINLPKGSPLASQKGAQLDNNSGRDGNVKVGVIINIHEGHHLAIPCVALRLFARTNMLQSRCCDTSSSLRPIQSHLVLVTTLLLVIFLLGAVA